MTDGFIYLMMDRENPDNLVLTVSKKNEADIRNSLIIENKPVLIIYYRYFKRIKAAKSIIIDLIKSRTENTIKFEEYQTFSSVAAIESMVLTAEILEKTDELSKRQELSQSLLQKTLKEIKPASKTKPLFDEIDEYMVIEGNIDLLESMEIAIENPDRYPEIIDTNIRAARMGNKFAFDNLGFLYSSGLNSDFTDYQKALTCFNIAVDLGYMDSLISIAELYQDLGDIDSAAQKWNQYMQHIQRSISQGTDKFDHHTTGVAQYIINRLEQYLPLDYKDVINFMLKNSSLKKRLYKNFLEIEAESGQGKYHSMILALQSNNINIGQEYFKMRN